MLTQAQTISQFTPLLQSLAYKIVGCMEDAEDIVQDTFVKWLTIDQRKVANTKAYLVRSVTNNCLNHIKSLQRKKNECLDSLSILDQVKISQSWEGLKHDLEIEFHEVVSSLHKKLEPIEKAVFVLKEIFDVEYDDLAEIFNKKKDNCRQIFSRAKSKLKINSPKISFELPKHKLEQIKKGCFLGYPSDFLNEIKQEIASKVLSK